jgi:sugar O-acyltransferase (sialic acid O-acetyltransferase NeuD family)
MRVVIVGAGGHGAIVADILLCLFGRGDVVGFVDDDSTLEGTRVLGLPVLGSLTQLPQVPHDAIVVAIGDNRRRAELSDELEGRGERMIAAVHPRASIADGIDPGRGSMISAGAVIVPGVVIERGVLLNTRCSVDHHSVIAEFAHIGPGATLGADVSIGARTLVGLGASVMSGRRVGAEAVVGAGALESRDVPDGMVVTGVPARVVGPARTR